MGTPRGNPCRCQRGVGGRSPGRGRSLPQVQPGSVEIRRPVVGPRPHAPRPGRFHPLVRGAGDPDLRAVLPGGNQLVEGVRLPKHRAGGRGERRRDRRRQDAHGQRRVSLSAHPGSQVARAVLLRHR